MTGRSTARFTGAARRPNEAARRGGVPARVCLPSTGDQPGICRVTCQVTCQVTCKVTCSDDDSPLLSSRVHRKAERKP